jgi:EmrB/QacA subfamily drug resistance transporter
MSTNPDVESPQSLAAGEQAAAMPDPRRWWALAVFAAAILMVVLDTSIVNIALPQAQRDLNITDADRPWVVTAYTLAFGGLLLLGGRIADLLGRRRIFLLGLIGFAAASALGGLAPTAGVLFAARALQGVFAALLAPAALSMISVTFTDEQERARAFAVYGAVGGGGGAVGLILGGVLTEYANWRWCLFVNVPMAAAALLGALAVVTESRTGAPRRYDVPGAFLVTAGSLALVYAVSLAAEGNGWLAAPTVTLLVSAVVLLSAFVVVERRSEAPLLPLRVVTDRIRGGAFLTSALVSAGMFAMFLFLAYYLQDDLGYSPLFAGLAILPFSVGIVASASLAPRLIHRHGARTLMITGMTAATGAMIWLALLDTESGYWIGVLPALLVMSVGLGLVLVPLSILALDGVEAHDAGVASALLNVTQQTGGALGIALLNTLYTAAAAAVTAGPATVTAHLAGYRIVFAVAAGLFAAAIVVVLLARRTDTRAA